MSFTLDRKLYVFECDHCHETLETETSNFEEARSKINDEGWRTTKILGYWRHFDCRECMYAFQEALSKRMRERK